MPTIFMRWVSKQSASPQRCTSAFSARRTTVSIGEYGSRLFHEGHDFGLDGAGRVRAMLCFRPIAT